MKTAEEAGRGLIIETNSSLIAARHSYYVDSVPVMTDAIYDLTECNLREMVAAMPQYASLATVLTSVGSDLTNASGRMKHIKPMLSLENLYSFDDVKAWCNEFPEGTAFVVEPKIDGASLSCHYLNRTLVKAVTRGDSQFGEDVTKQMAASGAISLTLPEEFYPESLIEVRGEVFISQQQFDKINASSEKKYSSPRNLASGSMKLLDLDAVKARGLRFYPWQVEGIPNEYMAKKTLSNDFAYHPIQYFYLTTLGLPQPFNATFYNADTLTTAIDGYLRVYRDTVLHKAQGIGTDGYVIKLASSELRNKVGLKTTTPRWARSWKYQNQEGETTLKEVVWQVSRMGLLNPVGILEPINLGGASISRVSLNNWTWMQKIGITHLPCKVTLVRSGDVIPLITGVVS